MDTVCRDVLGYKSGLVIEISVNDLIARVEAGVVDPDQLLPGLKRIKRAIETAVPLSVALEED